MDTTDFRLINWDLAATTAATLVGAGPVLTPAQIAAVVADLRTKADASVEHVHRITGLEAAKDLRDSQVLIVDRPGWARANTQSFEAMLAPAMEQLAKTRGEKISEATQVLSSLATGVEMGAILAFMSSKVLGQYDPFAGLLRADLPAGGRLMLVAPNIVAIERELKVDTDDFRLWVTLHEQTHRVQFAAAPWLREHLQSKIAELLASLLAEPEALGERLRAAASEVVRGKKELGSAAGTKTDTGIPPAQNGLLAGLRTGEQKAIISHITAVMSLLEGHANVVMDAVDSSIVPSVRTIRQRFGGRGKDRSALEKWMRKLLGLDAKMRQYADGQRFVTKAVKLMGMEGFNKVWEGEENLPTEHELHHPEAWVTRMSGADAGTQ
ncbi:zinc-dependent metalloprotease [Paeniglutamicibacter gangotriensis]|uniref:Zinc-dependent metalloprotease n=1 Tax=Paeniglutamicibacter gangotriensis TaxID=254787 RepID=A0A5B0EQB6_9MICC|nr:zinc-dependent metalloprotease [Paeniglutamicibacter gangotriensis]KAA0979479.1 zinc-dependent metalloprotease [Paeniglutamicibacter gangotriensis]